MTPRTQNGVSYVREHQAGAEDAYVLALVCQCPGSGRLASRQRAGRLDQSRARPAGRLGVQEGNAATWPSGVATFMGSEGKTGSIETTALAALAFLRSGEHPDLANAALTYLIQQKDNFGTWYSTQATVLTLKALIESLRARRRECERKCDHHPQRRANAQPAGDPGELRCGPAGRIR